MKNWISRCGQMVVCVALLSFAAVAQNAAGTVPQGLSLQEAIERALQHSEDVALAQSEYDKAQTEIRQAYSHALPNFSAGVTSTRYLDVPIIQFEDQQIPIKQDWELSMNVQVQQAVWAFGRVSTAIDIAKSTRSMRRDSIEAAERELRKQVHIVYHGAQLAQKVLEAMEQSLANAQRSKSLLERRFSSGRIPRLDNIKMQSDIASRSPRVADARKQVELMWMQLNLMTGLPLEARYELTTDLMPELKQLDEQLLFDQALRTNPQLRASEKGVLIAEKYKSYFKAEHYPMLSLFGSFDRIGTGDHFTIGEERMNNSLAIGLNLRIPLWDGGATHARYRQSVQEYYQSQLQRTKLEEAITLGIRSSLASYRANVEKYRSAQTAFNLAQETFGLAREQFSAGRVTLKDLNDFELGLTTSKIQVATALFDVQQSLAEIQSFLGEGAGSL